MDAVSQQKEATRNSFCSVPCTGMVYVGPRTKAEFDEIHLPATVHEWEANASRDLIENDGHRWETRCTSKVLNTAGVVVIFQWFDHRHAEASAPAGGVA